MNATPPPLPDSKQQRQLPKPARGGCGLLGGCLALAIAAAAGFFGLAGYLAYDSYKQLSDVLDDKPSVRPFVPTEADRKKLEKKMDAIAKVQKEGGRCEIELDSDDINTAIAGDSEGDDDDSPRFRIQLEGDAIRGKVSFPFDDDGMRKFVNGDAVFSVKINKGRLDVRLKEILLKGRKPPFGLRVMIGMFQHQNLARQVNTHPQHRELREKLRHCRKLEIKNGKVRLELEFPKPEGGREPEKR